MFVFQATAILNEIKIFAPKSSIIVKNVFKKVKGFDFLRLEKKIHF